MLPQRPLSQPQCIVVFTFNVLAEPWCVDFHAFEHVRDTTGTAPKPAAKRFGTIWRSTTCGTARSSSNPRPI
jgi:hypothetical protein